MARVNHKRVKQLLNEKRSRITDRQFFTSRILAGHFEDMAMAQTRRYKYNRRIHVAISWSPKSGEVACTNIIVSMSAAKAACCTDVRQFHLSNISRCAGVRATRMSSCAKNCDNVTPKASQIFSSDANDGVIDFLYHEEMVDCGRPERSAS